MDRTNISKPIKYIACGILLLLIFIMMSQFPPTGDDWVILGRSTSRIHQFFEISVRDWNTQNGRILGNVFFNVGIHGRFFVKVMSLLFLLYLLIKINKTEIVPGVIISLAVLFFIPIPIFREVWVWTAGFYNYETSAVLLLLLMHLMQTTSKKRKWDFILSLLSVRRLRHVCF